MTGHLEFGQTHVVSADETRIAPRLIAGRETLLLFTPETALDESSELLVAAFNGDASEPLGVLALAPPSERVPILEQELTDAQLPGYGETSFHTYAPAAWMREGAILRFGLRAPDGSGAVSRLFEHALIGLGAPHPFTLHRAKVVLWGDAADVPQLEAQTDDAATIARDWWPTTPFAELRWVDAPPLLLEALVVASSDGAQLVWSDNELAAVSTAYQERGDHWTVLKHHVTISLALAHQGRGLSVKLQGRDEGDNSPYSYGTTLGQGWFRDADGAYHDISDATWAGAGWTGWTGMNVGLCGNTFTHELGHSFTLNHFDDDTAEGFGISDEYPDDGVHLEGHPWGYDAARRTLRSWYRVDEAGPVYVDGDTLQGKADPMNGGEAVNTATCFPQFTAYHARRAQEWAQATPLPMSVDGVAGLYKWDEATAAYTPDNDYGSDAQPVTAHDVPAVTCFGAVSASASRVYPPVAWSAANLFELPDPFGSDLSSLYAEAQYYLKVVYQDGSEDNALLARTLITDDEVYLFSVNIDATRQPRRFELRAAAAPYPAIVDAESSLLHARELDTIALSELPRMVSVSSAALATQDGLTLRALCVEDFTCGDAPASLTWRSGGAQLYFTLAGSEVAAPTTCAAGGTYSTLRVPVVHEETGETYELTMHAQRWVEAPRAVGRGAPLEDATPWSVAPNAETSLRAWVPDAPNSGLLPGMWSSAAPTEVRVWSRGAGGDADMLLEEVALSVLLTARVAEEHVSLDHALDTWSSATLLNDESVGLSGLYFVPEDPRIGSTARMWWGDSSSAVLRVPVFDETSPSTHAELVLRAWHQRLALTPS